MSGQDIRAASYFSPTVRNQTRREDAVARLYAEPIAGDLEFELASNAGCVVNACRVWPLVHRCRELTAVGGELNLLV